MKNLINRESLVLSERQRRKSVRETQRETAEGDRRRKEWKNRVKRKLL